jgi:hypothetical protein
LGDFFCKEVSYMVKKRIMGYIPQVWLLPD